MSNNLRRIAALWLCAIMLLCSVPARAAKQWAEVGVGPVEADASGFRQAQLELPGAVTECIPGVQYVIDVNQANTGYIVSLQPGRVTTWYTVAIQNNGIELSGLASQGGVSLYMGTGAENWLVDNLALKNGKTTLKVRVEPNMPFYLAFVAYNNTVGTITFELIPEEDAAGESMQAAQDLPAGELGAQTIAVPGDEDWYCIPRRSSAASLSVYVHNTVEETLLVELYDEFSECLAYLSCPAGETVILNCNGQQGSGHYVRVVGMDGAAYGAYEYGWCDGVHHCLTEESVKRAATCAADGQEGRACIFCSQVLWPKTTPRKAHEYGKWRTSVEATAEAEGAEIRVCTGCGNVEVRTIPRKESFLNGLFGN